MDSSWGYVRVFLFIRYKKMFSIVWKLIILYLCESNIEFYMRVKEIPILLLTGYLGSGKTTLVNHILSNKRGIKFAVIVNDIGEVNIDADLIQKGDCRKERRKLGSTSERLYLLYFEDGFGGADR